MMSMGGSVTPYQYLSYVLLASFLLSIFSVLIYQLGRRLIHQIVVQETSTNLSVETNLKNDALVKLDEKLHRKSSWLATPLPYRILWYGIAVLWLLAGILQAQPMMFTNQFISSILQNAYLTQVPFLRTSDLALMERWSHNPVTSNIEAIMIQLFIGVLLLLNRRNWLGYTALGGSIVWGLLVWAYGEGFGNTFTTGRSFLLSGTPGAVLFYVVASILLFLPIQIWENPRFYSIMRVALAVFWGLAAIWQIIPSNGAWQAKTWQNSLQSMIQTPAGQPAWVTSGINMFMRLAIQHVSLVNSISIGLFFFIAVLFLLPTPRALMVGISCLVLFLVWWWTEDFGVLGGMGTDVNVAPLVGLFTVVFYPSIRVQKYLGSFGKPVKHDLK